MFFFVFSVATYLWPGCPLSFIFVVAAASSSPRCSGRSGEREVGRRAGSGESNNCRRRRCCRGCRRRCHRRRRCRRFEEEGARSKRGPVRSSSRSESSLASHAESQAAQHRWRTREGERERDTERVRERDSKKFFLKFRTVSFFRNRSKRGCRRLSVFVGFHLALSLPRSRASSVFCFSSLPL